MKPIKIIIISIFILSGILIALLFQQKTKRIDSQLSKISLGWNPVAIKKITLEIPGREAILLTKADGVWKTNQKFDGMATASQIILYLSTVQIENIQSTADTNLFSEPISLQTFDKNSSDINHLLIGKEVAPGVCAAKLNNEKEIKLLHNNLNNKSLRKLLESII